MDKVVSMEPGGDTVRAMVDYVMIGNCSSNPEYSGRMVKDIAAEKGIPPLDLVLNILRDDKLETDAIYYSTLFYTHVLETMTQRDTAHLFYGKSEVPLLQRRRDP